MGGGRSRLGGRVRGRTGDRSRERFTDFGSGYSALVKSTAWFRDPNNSNSADWLQNLRPDSKQAIKDYTGESGISYHQINSQLYTKDWENIDPAVKRRITSMDKAMDNTVLLKGMQITRQADFKIFGAPSGHKMTVAQVKDFINKNGKDGVLTNKGYLSAGANNHGASIDGSGLVIHIRVPPSKGAGAYINPISKMGGSSENEFLLNRGSMYKFDVNSVHVGSDGKIHVNARWVGLDKKKKKRR